MSRTALATTLVALVATLLSISPAADGRTPALEPPPYVALGDSYSSGTGTRTYLADGTTCQRSVYAYPALIAAARGYALSFRACSGATVRDVTDLQLSALGPGTRYVTVSVGGNDAGFADVLSECALPWWASSCHRAIDEAQAFVDGVLPGRLATLYAAIGARAPGARVVVVGYPRLFNGRDCHPLTFFTAFEMARLNATADLLNTRSRERAAALGLEYADPTGRFVGHAVCDTPEWINGLSFPVAESFHPNRPGHSEGYVPTVAAPLTGARVGVTARTLREARRSADALTATQRRLAARDRRIEPAPVRVPDLDSPAVRAAARRAGIDLDRWRARHRIPGRTP